MNKKVLVGLVVVLVGLVVAGIILSVKMPESLTAEEKTEITTLVENFGKTLVKVDKVAPDEEIAKSIKENYRPFLGDKLLWDWTFNPAKALGRICSSPWPDRIEILSIEKIDEYTVKVKGNVIWVTSGGENKLEVSEKVPVVLMLRKDSDPSSSQKFLIDRVYSNEYAFYNGKELLKTLKEAFKGMYYIGERYEPFAERQIYFTQGTSPVSGAIVDMGTGGAYVEYYAICEYKNGKLEVANFKDKDGNIAPLFFDEGASVKNEAKLCLGNGENSNLVVYQSVVDRDDSGKVTNVEVEAYLWNSQTNTFEYSKDLSESFVNELKEKLAPKTVSLSSLKFTEIKGEFPAIGTIAIYGDEIAFSCGSEKNRVNNASGTINHIEVYDTKQNKIVYSIEVSKNWANIDKIEMNDEWILFRVVEDTLGAPTECFAINRKTNKIETVVPTEFEGNYVVVDDIALAGDSAFVSMDVFEKNGTPEEAFRSGAPEGIKIVEVYLPNGSAETRFDETKDGYYLITNFKKAGRYVVVTTVPNPNKKPPIGISISKGLSWIEVNPGGQIVGDAPNDIIGNNFICTPDGYIIFENNGRIARTPIYDSINNNKHIDYFSTSAVIDPYFLNVVASSEYVISINEDEKNISEVPSKNGNVYTLVPSLISIYNTNTGETKTIKDTFVSEASLDGSKLCFINHRQDNTPDSIIYLDLKESGF